MSGLFRTIHTKVQLRGVAVATSRRRRLAYGFHQTKQGLRFPISDPARREVLARHLKLNHERYAEEVAAGLHEKGKAKGGTKGMRSKETKVEGQATFFKEE